MPSMYAENLTYERVYALGWKGGSYGEKCSLSSGGPGWSGTVYFDNTYVENGLYRNVSRLSSEKMGRFITVGPKTSTSYNCSGVTIMYQDSTSYFNDYKTAIGTSGNRNFWYANRNISGSDQAFGLMASNDNSSQGISLTKANKSSGAEQYTAAYPCKFLLRFDGFETGLVENTNGTYQLIAK